MSQSLSKVLIHIVFSTKNRYPFLADKDIRGEMHAYLGGVCNNLDCQVIIVGGVAEHVHILCRLSRNLSIAKLAGEIKRSSSKWIKTKNTILSKFEWQNGYGAFSISEKEVDSLKSYISNQEGHHQKKSFQDEFRILLKEFEIEYNEQYVWD